MTLKNYIISLERNHAIADKLFEYDRKDKLTTLRKIVKRKHTDWLDDSDGIVVKLVNCPKFKSVMGIKESEFTDLINELLKEKRDLTKAENLKRYKLFIKYLLDLPIGSVIDKSTSGEPLRYQIKHNKAAVSSVIWKIAIKQEMGRPKFDFFQCLEGLFIDFNRRYTIDNIINS